MHVCSGDSGAADSAYFYVEILLLFAVFIDEEAQHLQGCAILFFGKP